MATKVGDLYARLGLDLTEFSRGLESAKRSLSDVGRDFAQIGTSMSAAFTAPLGIIAGFSVKSAAGFESAMNKVQGLLQDFSDSSPRYLATFKGELENLSTLAMKLGADTQFSAKQAADAMGELAAAGFNATQIMQGMEGVLSLAAVGQMKLAEAAEIAAAVVGGFGISAEHLSKVADVLAKASSVSAASVQDLGYSFKYIGPVAKAAGVSFNETAAALTILANAGIKGESAGTALRNMFMDILKPSEQAQKILDRLGITITDAAGKLRPMADLLDEFKNKNLSLAEGFQIWGARFSDVLPLLQKGGEELRKMTAEMEKSEGSAKKMADTFRKGLAGMWEEFTGSLETLGISIGQILQPAIEPALKWMTKLANEAMALALKFKELDPSVQLFVGGMIALPAVIGPVLLALGALSSLLSAMVSGAGLAVSAFKGIVAGAGALHAGIVGLPAMIGNISTAIGTNMVGALTMGEKALMAFGYAAAGAAAIFAGWQLGSWLRTNIPAVREFGDAIGGLILKVPGVQSAINKMMGATGAMAQAMGDQAFAVKKLEEALRAKGIQVSQGSMSLDQYNQKLLEMARAAGAATLANSKTFEGAGQALQSIKNIQQEIATIASKVTIGMTDKGQQKAAIIELEAAMKGVLATQNKINEAVKAGKIDKKSQIDMEKQLAETMSFAKGTLDQLNYSAGKTGAAYDGLAGSKGRAAKAAKELQAAQEMLLNFSLKVQDVMEDLPRTFDEYAKSATKMKDIPKELQKQATQLENLQEKVADFRREIQKAPVAVQGAMKGIAFGLDESARSMERWFNTLVNQRKAMDTLVKDLETLAGGFEKVNVSAMELPPILSGLAAIPSLADLPKPVYSMNEALKGLGIAATENLDKAAAKAREMYQVIEASSATIVQKKQALAEYLQAQIEADTAAGRSTEDLRRRLVQTNKELEALGVKTRNAANDADEFTQAMSRQISTIFDDLGKGITDAILSGKNLGDMFADIFAQAGKALMRFVVDYMVNGLMKALKDSVLNVDSLGAALGKLWEKFIGIFDLFKSTPSVPGGGNIPGTGGGGAGASALTGLTGWMSAITAGINAIFGALSFFQGRRMEQDIGRIEVTTRGQLNQLISLQDTFNKWLPALDQLNYLQHIDLMLAIIMERVVQGLSTEGVTNSLDQLAEGMQNLTEVVNSAGGEALPQASEAANQLSDSFSNSVRSYGNVTSSLSYFGETTSDVAEEVGSAGMGMADTFTDVSNQLTRTAAGVSAGLMLLGQTAAGSGAKLTSPSAYSGANSPGIGFSRFVAEFTDEEGNKTYQDQKTPFASTNGMTVIIYAGTQSKGREIADELTNTLRGQGVDV